MMRTVFDVVLFGGALFATIATEPVQPKIPVPQVPQSSEVDPKMPFFLVCAKACDDCADVRNVFRALREDDYRWKEGAPPHAATLPGLRRDLSGRGAGLGEGRPDVGHHLYELR